MTMARMDSRDVTWDELIPLILEASQGQTRTGALFRDAIAAIGDATRQGYLSEAQVGELIQEMAAVLLREKLQEALSPRLWRVFGRGLEGHRSGAWEQRATFAL